MTNPLMERLSGLGTPPETQKFSNQQQIQKALQQVPAPPAEEKKPAREEDLVEPIQQVNEAMRPYGVEFELRETNGRIITRVVDRETGEVIRQIPPESVLDIVERLQEGKGLLVDDTI